MLSKIDRDPYGDEIDEYGQQQEMIIDGIDDEEQPEIDFDD